MKIGMKLGLGFSVVVILIWVAVYFSTSTYTDIDKEYEALEGGVVPGVTTLREMEAAANQASLAIMYYTMSGYDGDKEVALSALEELERLGLERLEHVADAGQEERGEAEELLATVRACTPAAVELIGRKEQGVSTYETLIIRERVVRAQLDSLLEQIRRHQATHMEELIDSGLAVHEASDSGMRLSLIVAGLVTLLAVSITWFVRRSIVNPLYALHRGTELIGGGSLDHKVGTDAKDEIGQLSRAFDRMTENLKETTTSMENLNREIAERRRVEEALRQSQEWLQRMFESVAEGVTVVDLNGTIVEVNDKVLKMYGFDSKDDILGRSVFEYIVGLDTEMGMVNLGEAQRQASAKSVEYTFLRRDGSDFPGELTASVLKDASGKTVGFVGVTRDITERKRVEEERAKLLEDMKRLNQRLEESNRELQDFAYIASHDLREPLRKMSAFAGLIQDSLQGKLDEDQKENLDFMVGAANRMQRMIDDLLTYSRVSSRARPNEKVDLNEVVENLKDLELATQLDETGGTIHVREPLPAVCGDPSQISQLLQNLIANGLKFHREGMPPEVTICAHEADSIVLVEVQDNGIGIAEEYQEQVFTMFRRLHSTARYDGTGIGLAVCKKIASRHGGDIGVRSTPGEGSTFWFTLPRRAAKT